jgi:RNA polymerase sigma factor (sigma-70 family)
VWARRRRDDQYGAASGEGAATDGSPRLRLVGSDVYPNWEAIYRDNVGWVYQVMFGKVGNRPDAEDLTAEVFLAALRPLRVSASVAETRGYLMATARTVLASFWRRTLGRQLTVVSDEEIANHADPAIPAEPDEHTARAATADTILAQLPDNYRRVLELRFLDGRSCKDAAEAMGVTLGNVKVLQHRALQAAAKIAERIGV